MLVEKVSNRPYPRNLDEEIPHPLELTATSYDSHLEILSEHASGYTFQRGESRTCDFLDMGIPSSAGGRVSTVDELLRWNAALPGGKLLIRISYDRMFARYPETESMMALMLSNIFNPFAIQPVILRLSDFLPDQPASPRI